MSYDQLNSRLEVAEHYLCERYQNSAATVWVWLPPIDGVDAGTAELHFCKVGTHRGLFVRSEGPSTTLVPLLHARLTLRIRAAYRLDDIVAALAERDQQIDGLVRQAIADVDRFINVMSNGATR